MAGSEMEKKLVVAGDSQCGKTSLLVVLDGGSVGDYPMGDHFTVDVAIDGQKVKLTMFDTGGLPVYASLRPMTYHRADIILLVFSIDDRSSLMNIKETWYPEVNLFCPTVRIILIGNKTDLRSTNSVVPEAGKSKNMKENIITTAEGQIVAEAINAFAYIECSASEKKGIALILETAARAALTTEQNKKKRKEKNACHIQ